MGDAARVGGVACARRRSIRFETAELVIAFFAAGVARLRPVDDERASARMPSESPCCERIVRSRASLD